MAKGFEDHLAKGIALLEAGDQKKAIADALAKIDGVTAVAEPFENGGGQVFALSTSKDVRADVSRAVVGAGWDLIKLDYARSELEDTFIRLVENGDANN